MFVPINDKECNIYIDEDGVVYAGKGPQLGPGLTNLGQYFILLDGGHRLPVFLK